MLNQGGLMYGRVYTVDDQVWQGVLRWGDEEAFWDDLFIARKAPVEAYYQYLTGDQIRALTTDVTEPELDLNFWGLWQPPYPRGNHAFRCRFGDLSAMFVTGDNEARLFFRDGQSQVVFDGEIVGKELHIVDSLEVDTRVEWNRIAWVEFLPTPANARRAAVQPIYGSVFTTQGAFEGFILWDAEESLSTDRLAGKNDRGKVSLPFGEIQEIRVLGDSAEVTTFAGRRYRLGGSDDVGEGNHDIIVKNDALGHVRIPWSEFRFARFFRDYPAISPRYDDFEQPHRLCATVTHGSGRQLAGTVVFDLDERFTLETVEGEQEGIVYHLLLKNIRRIERRNYDFAAVTLRNGDKLFLGDQHDLTDRNWGLLIWYADDRDPVYWTWKDIQLIEFP